jgi:LCP family protein required for cell wall assembly
VPLPQSVPKDPWEWALVERLGPGEVAPLEADARVLADAKAAKTKPWTTILLLGTDEGPGNWGARTDTIILAAIQHGTGRAAAFGIPRNLAQVPLGVGAKPFKQPLNALYGLSGGGEEGTTALKQAVSALLGIRVDYYAMVNLLGFADLVDALGGVEIAVKERLVDEVTAPGLGRAEAVHRRRARPHVPLLRPRGARLRALAQGLERLHANGSPALLPERDGRPARPRPRLRHFGSLAKTIESNVHTDIPAEPAAVARPTRQLGRLAARR